MKMKKRKQLPDLEARQDFSLLMLSNPNFFGTQKAEQALEPMMDKCCDTSYEELVAVGYHPQQKKLEAVVHIYQPEGYGSGVCGQGTREYVRFFLSRDNGATWQDVGVVSFQAYNILAGTEGQKHLEYAVSLPVDPAGGFCFTSRLARVRAILSWQHEPPKDDPGWQPVWGNVQEVTIQIEPELQVSLPDFLDAAKIELPENLQKIVDPKVFVPLKKVPPDPPVLLKLYQEQDVPAHRFAFKELMQLKSQPEMVLDVAEKPALLDLIEINPDLLGLLKPVGDGNTDYEELVGIGLDPNLPNMLTGVIHLKRSAGFMGGPCTDGSTEYVTFWADMDGNGVFEKCLGTASVQVYDLKDLPPEGAYYAVRLPVDLSEFYQDCHEGGRVIRIRAILSWNVPIGCASPDQTPVWGNRKETLIALASPVMAPAGRIAILGGVPVSKIDGVTGLTTSGAFFAGNNLPIPAGFAFGGHISVQGVGMPGLSYKVEVSTDGILWTPVITNLQVVDQFGYAHPHKPHPVTHRFDYLPVTQNVASLLAIWPSSGDDLVWFRLTVYNGAAGDISAVPAGAADVHVLQLDNTLHKPDITITTGTGDCGKFQVGTTIGGTFVARDKNLRDYRLSVIPAINDPGEAIPSPHSGTVQTAPAPGDSWTLDTTGMKPCGYVIVVGVRDKVVVNSAAFRHYRYDSAGFCLK